MWFEKFTPKKFLGRMPLRKGALLVGIFMLAISIICVISLVTEVMLYKECESCAVLVIHNAYSFSINAIIYCVIMVCINIWFIWGVKKQKSSVVLSWVVITAMWWMQSLILVLVLLCIYIKHTTIGWIFAFLGAMIAFIIFAYFILVGYGYWLEIRKSSRTTVTQ